MITDKEPSNAERLYNYLQTHCYGKRNGVVRPSLALTLGISERELRKLTKEINESPEYEKLISTTHSCYMCETKAECEKSIRNTWRVALALIKKAKQMERKVGLNGQIKINVGDMYNDIVKTFEK